MNEEIADATAGIGSDSEVEALLKRVCDLTGMGFAAVAYVSETRWIACQVEDRVAFGLKPGDELEIKKTICNDIRASGHVIAIDDTDADPYWWNHPVPILYGFHSYVSLPIFVDGDFFGTLCALDDAPREHSLKHSLPELERMAQAIAVLIAPGLSSETSRG